MKKKNENEKNNWVEVKKTPVTNANEEPSGKADKALEAQIVHEAQKAVAHRHGPSRGILPSSLRPALT